MFGQGKLYFLLLQGVPLLSRTHLAAAEKLDLEQRAPVPCTVTPVTPPGPPPKGFFCGVKGTLARPSPITMNKLPNLNACRDLCLNQAGCISFGYGPGKQCTTYSKNIVNQGLKKATTGMALYNKRCFKKTCACPSGQVACNGECADASSNDNNCGTCGTVCGGGSSCIQGTCACPQDTAFIGGVCTDINANQQNCGSVGFQCGAGARCRAGQCVCDLPLGLCSRDPHADCSDLNNDDNNCGRCGTECSGGSSCVLGTCTCPNGEAFIEGVCSDIASDPRNCGSVGFQCGDQATCRAGQCACEFPFGLCSGDPHGDCTNLASNPDNCGSCGNQCDPSAFCNEGTCDCEAGSDLCFGPNGPCVLLSSTDNCGACGTQCAPGLDCVGGQCQCPIETELCNGQCLDLQNDVFNCGGCGNECGDGASCSQGQCVCPSGQDLCFGPNGPCQDIRSDPDNCGACNNVCGGQCDGGQCTCPVGSAFCDGFAGSCTDLTSDSSNCGQCGNECAQGQTCVNGGCTCPASQNLCPGAGGGCVQIDLQSDANNCGSCGHVCNAPLSGGNPTCYKGVCVECSGDFCSQANSTPCGSQGNCNCVGIEGSTTYGRCADVNDGTSCEAFSPRCNTNADCPSDKYCGNYQIACNCRRNACFPKSSRCDNNSNARRIFRRRPATNQEYNPNILAAKCPGPYCDFTQ